MTNPQEELVEHVPDGPAEQQPPKSAEELEAEQLEEWTTFVATAAIDYYGARAFNVGDPVPASSVVGEHAWVPEFAVRRLADDEPSPSTTAPSVEPVTVIAPAATPPVPPVTVQRQAEPPAPSDASPAATPDASQPAPQQGAGTPAPSPAPSTSEV